MRPHASLAAAALLLCACSYDFKNPAEELDSGEVTGRVVADLSGNGQLTGVGGVTVELKGSFNSQASRGNGSFFVMGLVPGRHTLLFTKGTTWALQRDVELGFGSDGQIEGVVLGDIRLRYAVTVGGSFSLPFYVFDGDIVAPPTAIAIDEVTGLAAAVVPETFPSGAYTGRFNYTIPGTSVGPHRIRFAVSATYLGVPGTWVGGPITQNIPDTSEGQSITLAPTTIRPPDLATTGKLRFRVSPSAGAPPVTVRVNTVPVTTEQTPAPDSTGWVELDLTEGIYSVFLDLGAAVGGGYEAPASVEAIVVAGQTTELGTLYVVATTDVIQGGAACLRDADCGGGTCHNGTCSNAVVACMEGSFPECANWSTACFMTGGSLTPCSGGAGYCATGPFGDLCIPAGAPACIPTGEPIPVQLPICGLP